MRKFYERPFGPEVDLDDDSTYDYLPQNENELDKMMFREIGFTLCYMNHFHPDAFKEDNEQRKRVMEMIEYFCRERQNNYGNMKWFREQVYLFHNETENMC